MISLLSGEGENSGQRLLGVLLVGKGNGVSCGEGWLVNYKVTFVIYALFS